MVDEGSAGVKVISELVSGNEYRGSWGDPRKEAVEAAQATIPAVSSAGQAISDLGRSLSDAIGDIIGNTVSKSIGGAVADVGNSVGNAVADTASSLGGLFDINPGQPAEEPEDDPFRRRIKPKKKKKRGWGQGM